MGLVRKTYLHTAKLGFSSSAPTQSVWGDPIPQGGDWARGNGTKVSGSSVDLYPSRDPSLNDQPTTGSGTSQLPTGGGISRWGKGNTTRKSHELLTPHSTRNTKLVGFSGNGGVGETSPVT